MPALKIGIPVLKQFYLGYYIMSCSAVTTKLSQTWLFSHQVKSNSSPHGLQHHAGIPCPSPSPRVCPSSSPLHQWYHPTMSSSVTLFSFCLQSFPASGCFPTSWIFTSGGQSTGASASFLPMNIQDWFPLGWTDLISLQAKGLSRVFSSTTIPNHQFFSTQLILWSTQRILVETVTDFIFLGSRITVDGHSSHEIKRCLLLGRKSMTNVEY